MHFGRGHRGPEWTASAGGMKALFVVARGDRLRDLAFHLHSEVIGESQVATLQACAFRGCEGGCQAGSGGVGEQSVHAFVTDGKLPVIVIVGMHGERVGKGREARRILEV